MGSALRIYEAGRKKLLRKTEYRSLPSHVATLASMGDRIYVGDLQVSFFSTNPVLCCVCIVLCCVMSCHVMLCCVVLHSVMFLAVMGDRIYVGDLQVLILFMLFFILVVMDL